MFLNTRDYFRASILITALGITSAYASDTGLITFDGAVSDATCTLSTSNGVDSSNITLSMPVVKKAEVSSATLASGGVGDKEFEFLLNDCPDTLTAAVITFSSQQFAELSNGTLKVDPTLSGAAQNVSIALFNNSADNKTQVKIGDPTDTPQSVTLTDGSGKFAYKAAYVPSADWSITNPVISGKVSTNATFTLSYE